MQVALDSTSPQDLLDALRRREPDAFQTLYRSCYRRVASAVLNHGGNTADAEDFFQEALYVLLKNLGGADFKIHANVCTYLYGVARNLWLKKNEKFGKEQSTEDDALQRALGNQPDNSLELLEDLRLRETKYAKALDAIRQTGEECQKVILAFYYEEKTDQEIAETTGYAQDYVRLKRFRCMNKLKNLLGL